VTTHTKALDRAVRRLLERTQRDLKRIELRSPLWAPDRVLLARRQRVDAAWLDARRILDVRLHARRGRLAALAVRLEACNPSRQLGRRRERLTLVAYRLEASVRGMAQRQRQRFESVRARLEPAVAGGVARRRTAAELLVAKLDGRDPTRILQRGYAIVTVNGVALRDAAAVAPGALVRAQLARGRLDARVEAVRDDGGK
jgi:exodeoxyribonuclease VII large subunit